MEISIITGMTDAQLEAACKPKIDDIFYQFSWTSEVYSFGKCFREIAHYPRVFPLFIYSDHGAGLHSNLYPHELNNKAKVHVTWHPLKEKRHQLLGMRKIVRIPHPWILYRRQKKISRGAKPKGTIVFFTHHVPGVKWGGHDTEDYFEQLKSLPEKFQPVVICMHMHDVNAGHHKKLRRIGLPIVTVGNIYNYDFIDRFYDLVRGFAFGTSQEWGSQVAYLVELGIPYFFLGKVPELINLEHKEMPLGLVSRYQDSFHENYVVESDRLFSEPVDIITEQQAQFVSRILGLDSKVTQDEVSKLIWKEFFGNWPSWYKTITSILYFVFAISGLKKLIKPKAK